MIWGYWNSHRRIINAFFLWLSGITTDRDAILVNFFGRKEFFYFDFPLHYGDAPKKTKTLPASRKITFIIREPQGGEFVEEEEEGGWVKIFGSPEIEIFENKKRINGTAPLRWGLSNEHRNLLLRLARNAIRQALSQESQSPLECEINRRSVASPLLTRADVVVALWVKDKLRGARLIRDHHLAEAVIEGAIQATKDSRFLQIAKHELDDIRIEITILGTLKLPITNTMLRLNAVVPYLGYEMITPHTRGIFLPHVLKIKPPKDLDSHLRHLAEEKLHIPGGEYDAERHGINIFNVEDFIESNNGLAVAFTIT